MCGVKVQGWRKMRSRLPAGSQDRLSASQSWPTLYAYEEEETQGRPVRPDTHCEPAVGFEKMPESQHQLHHGSP
jgi:hypothetical protein